MERMKTIKDTLLGVVQGQLGNLESVDAKELGEVVDMIKDMEEAMYYCTIVEAMKEKHEEEPYRMYFDERYIRPDTKMPNDYYRDIDYKNDHYRHGEKAMKIYDAREGRSPSHRRMYMESKEMHHGKEADIKELQEYMTALSHDITEMIKDATTDEKTILQQKLTTLAQKIGA